MEFSDCLGFRFKRLSRIVTRKFNEGLKPFGLQISQVNILFAISENQGIRQTEIGEFMFLERSTLSREVALLIKEDLVKTEIIKGSRSPHLYLTEKGEKLVTKVAIVWRKIQTELTEMLGLNLLKHFGGIENKLSSN